MTRSPLFLVGLLIVQALTADEPMKPRPKFPLSKETTYVTGPLDKDGYIDYVAALNERLGQGVTPEKNANVLLWSAFGPRPVGEKGMPPGYFKALGMEEPPEKGDYLISFDVFLKERRKPGPDRWQELYALQPRTTQRPWAAKDFPVVAEWLKANEQPLVHVIKATQRPAFFNPLAYPNPDEKKPSLISALNPGAQRFRDLSYVLTARAMLRVGEGEVEDAWQDLLACHRLGRLVARGRTNLDSLVGIAIDQSAALSAQAFLSHARMNATQAQKCLADLQSLPPLPTIADDVDFGERFFFLDVIQLLRQGNYGILALLLDEPILEKPDPKVQQALERVDWESALRDGNRWYDRMAAALRVKDRAARGKALDAVEADFKALKKEAAGEKADLLKFLQGKEAPEPTVGKVIGASFLSSLLFAERKMQDAADRAEQVQHNLEIAFALAAYRLSTGRYPRMLEELAPKYLAQVPADLFSGQALIYRPSDDGYVLYSVGINGKDEEGRWYNDDPPGDDPSVRVPLPMLMPR